MRLHALQALVAAIDTGSLRAAARQLQLSQPALTKMVRELERELGAPLLERTTVGVSPTAQGKVLHAHAKAATAELDEAVQQITQMGGRMVGELSIGVPANLVEIVRRLNAKDLEQAYQTGSIDYGGEAVPSSPLPRPEQNVYTFSFYTY